MNEDALAQIIYLWILRTSWFETNFVFFSGQTSEKQAAQFVFHFISFVFTVDEMIGHIKYLICDWSFLSLRIWLKAQEVRHAKIINSSTSVRAVHLCF